MNNIHAYLQNYVKYAKVLTKNRFNNETENDNECQNVYRKKVDVH